MQKINILYVAHDANLYGSNQSLFFLIKELREKYSVNPTVLVPTTGSFTKRLEEEGVPFKVADYCLWQAVFNTRIRFVVKSVMRRIKNYIAEKKIKKYIKGENFVLVHSNSSTVKIGAKCAEYLNIPHVWHIREFGREGWGMQYMYGYRYVYDKYRKAQLLIAVSRGIEEKYRREFPNCNICTIYNGIPADLFRQKTESSKEVLNFCQVGYISAGKNQIQTLEACKILRDKYQLQFKMHIVGSGDGEYYQEFLKYLKDNKLEDIVQLWGFQEHVEELLPQMDVGIISSKMEGFGRVTVEFMLSGIPVIGYASGGTCELIEHMETGLLYHSVDELQKYMRFLIENRDEIRRIGMSAYTKARAEFTAENNARQIYQIYQRVIEG